VKNQWPLGSEVKRKALTGGAILYDASRASNLAPAWFDPDYWRSRGELEGQASGRGTAYFIRSGDRHLVLRHYHRGGLMARVSSDQYFWQSEAATRSFAEWQLIYHLHHAGLPVPAPVGARYLRSGATYTGDVITERILNTDSLAAALQVGALSILQWIAIGRCIRAFHNLGVHHADLNAHNILLGAEDGAVHLIDFDRGSLRKPGLWCDSNLVRLRRSLEKIIYGLPREHFSEEDWYGLLDGYRQT
jgi:3-deoxy-D-manno-octulosonic acid kinase